MTTNRSQVSGQKGRNSCCETIDSNLHLRHLSRATFISMIGALRRYVIVGLNTLD
jgi:hypothetical protein